MDASGPEDQLSTVQASAPEVSARVWVVRGGREGQSELQSLSEGMVAIGWGQLPDLSHVTSKSDVAALFHEHVPDDSLRQVGTRKVIVYDFVREIKVGDLVLLPLKTKQHTVAVGRVVGPYEYREDGPYESRHIRRVEWLDNDVPIARFGNVRRWIDLPRTVGEIMFPDAAELIEHMLATGQAIPEPIDDATTLATILEEALRFLQQEETDVDVLRSLVTEEGPAVLQRVVGTEWQTRGRIGIGTIADVPWIGIYPGDGAASAQSGYYVVFLFAADGSAVHLSLNQGIEKVRGGTKPILKRALDLRAAAGIGAEEVQPIELASTAARPLKYRAGNAFALTYLAGKVPAGDELRRDLATMLGYLRAAQDSGLRFDPEVEPLHIVLKWSASLEPQTLEFHEATATEQGSVWWGRFGEGGGSISSEKLARLREQITAGTETWAYFYGGAQAARAKVQDITPDAADVDDARLPGYYSKAQCNLFVRVASFEHLDSDWLPLRLVLASDPVPEKTQPALSNTTNPLYVYELFTPSARSSTQADVTSSSTTLPELNMDWLVAETLWTEADLQELVDAVRERGQVILAGPPGTGKTWVATHVARYLAGGEPFGVETIQFHPSYGYEDFIEGLRPVIEDDVLTFKRVNGVILEIASEMEDASSVRVLIIDELNRANIPRVFGELMYALEYRGTPIGLQYSKGFELPVDLKFICTMNTADRSIRSIDVALRRRFEIFECPADPEILTRYYQTPGHATSVPNLVAGFTALNDALIQQLDRHHTIGQSFFMASEYGALALKRTWQRQIKPLIEDYFFDQPDLVDTFKLEAFWPDL
jgi:5-methylcytosine-specific restriction protein B